MSAFGSITASENDIPQLLYWMWGPKASEPPKPSYSLDKDRDEQMARYPGHSLRRMSMIDTFKAVTLTRRVYFWAGLCKAGRFGLEEGTMGKVLPAR